MFFRRFVALLWLAFLASSAFAEDAIISNYDPGIDCAIVEETDDTVLFRCPGIGGVAVWMGVSDARWSVSFHAVEPTGLVLLQGFNLSHHPDLSIEWRFAINTPIAAIQRWRFYNVDGDLDEGTFVITKFEGDEVCHIGFVEIAANIVDGDEEAVLQMARNYADKEAADFSCQNDPNWIGNPPAYLGHTHHTFR